MATWIEDKHGNRCSVEHWGTKEAAQKALDSLVDCSDCSDCSDRDDLAPGERLAAIEVPVIANFHKRIYEAASVPPEALNMSTWHTCETTHCRAGWAVFLAGKDGKALESRFNTELAAMMIYDASDLGYKINPCRFYDSNEDALADMKKLAGV